MKQTGFLVFTFIVSAVCWAQNEIKWISPAQDSNISVNGLAWFEQNNHQFIRLPLKEMGNIPPAVWEQSLCPSSARIRFKTNSTFLRLNIRHNMGKDIKLSMYHMSSVAASGIDLYIGQPGNMAFWKTTKPQDPNEEYEHLYFENLPSEMREFTLYLPSYARLAELKIGVDVNSVILKPTKYKVSKPIVFYGSSITQGGCASRGSNSFASIVERQLSCDVINLGFSGSGKGEEIMAHIISQIDASAYVVDCVANMDMELIKARYEKFVRILRKTKPQIPVLLMTKIKYANEIELAYKNEYQRQNKKVFDIYTKFKKEGDKKVYFFDAGKIIKAGNDHPTVDGVHLTDRGFYMIAEQLSPKLKTILKKK